MADEEDDAARAFAHMEAELTVLRRTVERFGERLEQVKPRNYDATLGEIRDGLAGVGKRLDAVSAAPGVRINPEEWARQVQTVGAANAREAIGQMEIARRQLADTAGQLQRYVAQGVTAEQQARELRQWAGAGLAVGVALCMILSAVILFLPASWHIRERLASGIMRADRWTAAERLAESADPKRWANLNGSARLANENARAINACLAVARKIGRAQRCLIRVDGGRTGE